MKQWGRNRILQELKMREISAYCLRKAMEEIEEKEYMDSLLAILEKRASQISGGSDFKKNSKLARWAIGRGFEAELVWETLKKMAE